MANAALVPLGEYLRTSYEPDAEFVSGEIEERNVGEPKHSLLQAVLLLWLWQHDTGWNTLALQAQRVDLGSQLSPVSGTSIRSRGVPGTAPMEAGR